MSRQMNNLVCETLWTIMEYRVRGRVTPSVWETVILQIDDRLWSSVDGPTINNINSEINDALFPDDAE